LRAEGLVGEMNHDDDAKTASNGDLMAVNLRPGYRDFDFAISFLREREEEIQTREIDIDKLDPFATFSAKSMPGAARLRI
jgi:type III restriction enzyme